MLVIYFGSISNSNSIRCSSSRREYIEVLEKSLLVFRYDSQETLLYLAMLFSGINNFGLVFLLTYKRIREQLNAS